MQNDSLNVVRSLSLKPIDNKTLERMRSKQKLSRKEVAEENMVSFLSVMEAIIPTSTSFSEDLVVRHSIILPEIKQILPWMFGESRMILEVKNKKMRELLVKFEARPCLVECRYRIHFRTSSFCDIFVENSCCGLI